VRCCHIRCLASVTTIAAATLSCRLQLAMSQVYSAEHDWVSSCSSDHILEAVLHVAATAVPVCLCCWLADTRPAEAMLHHSACGCSTVHSSSTRQTRDGHVRLLAPAASLQHPQSTSHVLHLHPFWPAGPSSSCQQRCLRSFCFSSSTSASRPVRVALCPGSAVARQGHRCSSSAHGGSASSEPGWLLCTLCSRCGVARVGSEQ